VEVGVTDWTRFVEEVERRLARTEKGVPAFFGVAGAGTPYCPPVGLLKAYIQVPGGLVWYGRSGERLYWMWQPLEVA
jgi:hypothetical protein